MQIMEAFMLIALVILMLVNVVLIGVIVGLLCVIVKSGKALSESVEKALITLQGMDSAVKSTKGNTDKIWNYYNGFKEMLENERDDSK